jgi:hypothetical protein
VFNKETTQGKKPQQEAVESPKTKLSYLGSQCSAPWSNQQCQDTVLGLWISGKATCTEDFWVMPCQSHPNVTLGFLSTDKELRLTESLKLPENTQVGMLGEKIQATVEQHRTSQL